MILDHDGKGHAALRRLQYGPADRDELSTLRRMNDKQAFHLMNAMTAAALVTRARGTTTYSITPKGEGALRVLDMGHKYSDQEVFPNVRVFGRAA